MASRNILQSIFNNIKGGFEVITNYNQITKNLSEAEKVIFLDIFDKLQGEEKRGNDPQEQVQSSISQLVDMLNKQELKRLGRKIKTAEKDNNIEEVLRLLQEKSNYLKQRHNKPLGGVVEKR